jgi:signal transduction histidine kinase
MKSGITSLFRSLRFRLIASVVTIEVIMLSLLVWNNISIIYTTHTDRLRDTAASMIQQIANTSGSYMVAVDYASLKDYLTNIMDYRELEYLAVMDRSREVVIALGAAPQTTWPDVDAHPKQVEDGLYDIAREISVAGQPMGHILMGFSLARMDEAIHASRVRGVSIAAAEIFLTVVVTVLIGLGLTRRLGMLSVAAQEVERGNYTVSVPIESEDEIGKMAAAFNRMVAEISKRTRQREAAETRTNKLLTENRQLIQTSLTVQEEERRHLARELHDELGQCITAIQADAESIRDLSRGSDERVVTRSGAILDVSARIYEVVHSMMQRLRPGILDDLGLVEALRDEITAWQERHPDINCSFNVSGNLSSAGERINITIYRITQECLTNIAKYAQARTVIIDLAEQGGYLILEIADDGRGMDLSGPRSGLGLIGMRERVEALGGSIKLDAAEGQGLAVRISVPLHNDETAVA